MGDFPLSDYRSSWTAGEEFALRRRTPTPGTSRSPESKISRRTYCSIFLKNAQQKLRPHVILQKINRDASYSPEITRLFAV